MHLYPSISSELELAGKLIIPLLVFLLIAFVAKKVENKSISSLLEILLALGIMIYNIAVGIFLFQCVRPIISYWELDLIEWYPVPLFFAFFILVFNILFLLQDGAEFLLDENLLEHAPLLNFIINIAVSLSFILFIGYKRKSKL